MRRLISVLFVFALMVVFAPGVGANDYFRTQTDDVERAAVSPDGSTAGEITDFVITFIDPDPAIPGLDMKERGSVTLTLPDAFTDTGDSTVNSVALLQGWPQSPPAPPPIFPWTTTITGNTITAAMTADYGDTGPGLKQVHLLLNSFRNPAAGRYDIPVVIHPDPTSSATYETTARIQIISVSRPSINIVSVFSGGGPPPPFNNPYFQTIAAGEDSLDVGLYLWGARSSVAGGVLNALEGVDIVRTSPSQGHLVQDGRSVGVVSVEAPAGADDYGISTDGPSILGTSAVTALDVGILVMRLHTDPDATGEYVVTLAMDHGNEETVRITTE